MFVERFEDEDIDSPSAEAADCVAPVDARIFGGGDRVVKGLAAGRPVCFADPEVEGVGGFYGFSACEGPCFGWRESGLAQ